MFNIFNSQAFSKKKNHIETEKKNVTTVLKLSLNCFEDPVQPYLRPW